MNLRSVVISPKFEIYPSTSWDKPIVIWLVIEHFIMSDGCDFVRDVVAILQETYLDYKSLRSEK